MCWHRAALFNTERKMSILPTPFNCKTLLEHKQEAWWTHKAQHAQRGRARARLARSCILVLVAPPVLSGRCASGAAAGTPAGGPLDAAPQGTAQAEVRCLHVPAPFLFPLLRTPQLIFSSPLSPTCCPFLQVAAFMAGLHGNRVEARRVARVGGAATGDERGAVPCHRTLEGLCTVPAREVCFISRSFCTFLNSHPQRLQISCPLFSHSISPAHDFPPPPFTAGPTRSRRLPAWYLRCCLPTRWTRLTNRTRRKCCWRRLSCTACSGS